MYVAIWILLRIQQMHEYVGVNRDRSLGRGGRSCLSSPSRMSFYHVPLQKTPLEAPLCIVPSSLMSRFLTDGHVFVIFIKGKEGNRNVFMGKVTSSQSGAGA